MYDKFEVNMFLQVRSRQAACLKITNKINSKQGSCVLQVRWIAVAFSARWKFLSAKTKKPAAGGGAAGFRKKPNDSWEEECCRSRRRPWEEDGRLHIEGMREEVHRFDRNNHTYFLLSW
ncbi:hypothetical protein [Rhizobium hidalgonense]|uniref:hypothetical protein n=1 Tax=Rhizobium hidalgonense TaxID=1538159 RepID=UPI0012BCFC0D|nr:hypothetical protein [Rhizobium hidalgonense]MDR9813544.1 hypothetical protein [Rhizobium hidalgonense]